MGRRDIINLLHLRASVPTQIETQSIDKLNSQQLFIFSIEVWVVAFYFELVSKIQSIKCLALALGSMFRYEKSL